jgi:D-threo-aldose 1-dehydrogenase
MIDFKVESGKEKLSFPPVIFGTSGLGNLFAAYDEKEKYGIVKECVRVSGGHVVFDSAGKYGAGLSLEVLGHTLKQLGIAPDEVTLCNKLGWYRVPLKGDYPTFEYDVWKDIEHDAVQKIGYEGIIACFEQGNELLGDYSAQMVAVHDPDEYLIAAKDENEREERYEHILEAYRALNDLKSSGKVKAVGIGAKDWRVIRRLEADLEFDWVMLANSLTIRNHPQELLDFVHLLTQKGIAIINSAVFHSGFLVGGDYYDYRLPDPENPETAELFAWRTEFFGLCKKYSVSPAAACVRFSMKIPGIKSIALNTTRAERVEENVQLVNAIIPIEFWEEMLTCGLISQTYAEIAGIGFQSEKKIPG